GVNAEIITADTPHEERQLIIHRFEQGGTKIIVNVGTLVAGFDSDVRCIIYARPTKSEIRWVQALGRALRPVDNFTSLYNEYLSKRNHLLTTMDSGEGNHGI
ncbi:helicase-related protein, partial [Morganella morganii]